MKLPFIILICVILFSCKRGSTKENTGTILSTHDSTYQKINTNFLEKVPYWLKENNVPAVGIGLIENGKIKRIEVYGELEKGRPAPYNTIFNVASVTKTIGTVLVLKLVENGKWDLDEPLYKYWVDPDIANDPRHKKLTTRHILTHQTGFPNWRDDSPTGKLVFNYDPGTEFGYSGEGFQYLRMAIEKKFNKPIEVLTDSLIFNPLGMHDTRHKWDKNVEESRFAKWHDGEGKLYDIPNKTYWVSLDDDLLTTVEDYCKFAIHVMNGAGLSPALYQEMVWPQSNIKQHSGVALGWFTIKDLPNEENGIQHGGSDYGVKTTVLFFPKSKRGIVIFTNGDNGISIIINVIKEAFDNGETIWEYMYERDDLPEIVELNEKLLHEYTGQYINRDGIEIKIAQKGNTLILTGARFPKTTIYPESDSKFFVKTFDQKMEFLRNESGKVAEMVIYTDGKKWYSAKKIE